METLKTFTVGRHEFFLYPMIECFMLNKDGFDRTFPPDTRIKRIRLTGNLVRVEYEIPILNESWDLPTDNQ